MNVSLTPQLEELIRRKVESGRYPDEGAVVEEALRLLDERDRLEVLRAAVTTGKVAIDRGEFVEWTPDLMSRLRGEAEEEERRGAPMSDDAIP